MRSPRSPTGYTPSPRRRAVQGRGGLPVAGRSRRSLFEAEEHDQQEREQHQQQQAQQEHDQQEREQRQQQQAQQEHDQQEREQHHQQQHQQHHQQQQQERRSTLRVPLKRILRQGQVAERLRRLASRTTSIAFRGGSLFRLLLLRRFEEERPLPTFETGAVIKILQAASAPRRSRGGNRRTEASAELFNEARALFEASLLPSLPGEEPSPENLQKQLEDVAARLITDLKTNVRECFEEHVFRFISVVCFSLECCCFKDVPSLTFCDVV